MRDINGRRGRPKCCYPTTCCCGRNSATNGARVLAAADIFLNVACLLFLLAVRPFVRGPPGVLISAIWNLIIILFNLILLHAIARHKVHFVSVCQFFLIVHVVCLAAIVTAITTFAFPDLEAFVERWQRRDEPGGSSSGVLYVSVFILFGFSLLFIVLHVYLLLLLNGVKAAIAREMAENEKRVTALQAVTHVRIVEVMRHSLARRAHGGSLSNIAAAAAASGERRASDGDGESILGKKQRSQSVFSFGLGAAPKLRPITPISTDSTLTSLPMGPLKPGYYATHMDTWGRGGPGTGKRKLSDAIKLQ